MASLVEELVTVLEEEEKIYQTLISYGEKKTDILIRADVPELEKLTCLEQLASDDLVTHSNQQVQLLKDIANVLGRTEEKIYQTLISYGEKKTDILIRADVPELEKLTCLEQLASDDLVTHSNQQVQLLKDIANVLGRTEEKMTVTRLITLLESQPDVQKKLTEARDRLLAAADRMNHLNDQNVALIKQAIELNEFDLTLFKSLRQAPETANYDKTACNTGSLLGSSGFDAMS